ncbi:insulin receptor substrate 1-like [Sorex araneus]|uniref:insulin receptor substrate 1-like n=1 Tax=Sorex araneus TaxID=42254 RepID=UPI0024337A8C|nr:insulin receptor substrate 1-like [Sorex araneus]
MKPGDDSPEWVQVPPGPPPPGPVAAAVRLCGHLRKQKSQRRRFFVLRADPPRLDCFESEKKFRGGRAPPKLSVSLAGACTISKRVDARQRHLIVLYTRDRSLGVAAASEAEQLAWYSALLEVRAAAGPSSHEDPETWLLAPFQDVWPVTLRPKGLGRARGLGSGGYRLCLGSGVLSLQRKPRARGSQDAQASPQPALRLSLLSVRRCGHADSFFFLELGRSAPTGPGELWLEAPDAVVAQSIHETVLAAMKRLGDGGACGRADPPPSASRPSVSPAYESLASAPSSGLSRRARPGEWGEPAALPTLAGPGTAASDPDGLKRAGGYIRMGAGRDYELMGGGEAGGYMVMARPGQECAGTEYVSMRRGPPSPRAASPSRPAPCGASGELAGEYVCIEYTAAGPQGAAPDGRLNYIDLELIPPLDVVRGVGPGGSPSPHSYARIEFQNLRALAAEAERLDPKSSPSCPPRAALG